MRSLRRRRDFNFLLLSLAVHLFTVGFFSVYQLTNPPPAPKIEVEYMTTEEIAEKKARTKALAEALRDQVVEQQKQINDEKDEDSRFLSAFDQKVIKQTRAERAGQFKNTAKGGQPDEGRKDGDKTKRVHDEKAHHAKREKGELPDLKDLTPKFALTPGPKAKVNDDQGDPSATDDYIKDVETGLQTLLSTREFVYYSYYSRIKEALRQHWEPNVREKVKIIYRKGRSIASAKDRVTQVLVVLNAAGDLIRVEVITRSGVEALDAAAVEAFREAAPFPNPPRGMVEKDGTIKIRWDFVLEA